jgi:hypothetical protein
MKTFTLESLVTSLEDLNDSLTIYIAPDAKWNAMSQVAVFEEPEDGSLPSSAKGMKYFLEVRIAKEVLAVWQAWHHGRTPSLKEKCEALIYYAMNDAYLPA